ncbi:MAG: hypothetical protein HFG20_04290 [Anaerotruncus sp.]|nr:hypothetical protein [Anaerotruncus sp.]
MFGYVIPCKPQLKICEYELYKAVYCGLCKQLGRQYGPLARLTLSYDFAFLALLELSLSESPADLSQKRCILNPLKKIPCCGDCHALEFSSGVAMILFYYKVLDNLSDETFGKRMLWRLCMPFAKHAYQSAADQYAAAAQIVYETISRQSALESELCDSVDAAAEPSALALSGICGMLSQDSRQKRVLERLGYLLGRYVYLCDALDDLEKDAQQGRYNPFLLHEKLVHPTQEQLEAIRTDAKGSLFLTIGELEKTYELLELTHYKPILDNIIQLGLRNTVERIFLPKETNHR